MCHDCIRVRVRGMHYGRWAQCLGTLWLLHVPLHVACGNGCARMRVQIVSKCGGKRWGRHVRDGLEVLGFHHTCLVVIGLLGRCVQKVLTGF